MTLSWPVSAALSQHVYRRIGFRNTAALGMTAALALLAAFPLLPFPGAVWRPTLLSLLLGAALGLFQLPLIVGVQSTVGWAGAAPPPPRSSSTGRSGRPSAPPCSAPSPTGVISARLGSGTDLDAVARDPRGGRGAAGDRRGGRLGVRRGGVRGGSGAAGPADPGAAPVPRPGTGNRGGPPTGRDRAGEVIHGTTPPPATLTPDTRQPPPNRLISSSKPLAQLTYLRVTFRLPHLTLPAVRSSPADPNRARSPGMTQPYPQYPPPQPHAARSHRLVTPTAARSTRRDGPAGRTETAAHGLPLAAPRSRRSPRSATSSRSCSCRRSPRP